MSPVVATTLREARIASGLSLRELAEHSGLNKAIVSQIERGRLVATDTEAHALSGCLLTGERFVTRTMLVVEREVRA